MKNGLYSVRNKTVCIAAAIAFICSLPFMFACAPSISTPFDAEKILARLLTEVQYEDKLEDVSEYAQYTFAGLPKEMEIKMHSCGGGHADAIIMCQANNDSELPLIRSAIEEYIASSRQNAERYEPKEVSKYDNAVWLERDLYLIVCITEDVAAAKAILK